jgi:PPM family protein phosphatase
MNFAVYQATYQGGRKYNQDRVAYAYTDQALLLVLADGMGGHSHGELAAQITIQTYMQAFSVAAKPRIQNPEEFLARIMRHAHQTIGQFAIDQGLGGNPGTTCVAALVQDGHVCWAHAGDSRFYLLRDSAVAAVTTDHSVVQQWADWGLITAEEMKTHPDRNKITNCLGGSDEQFFVETVSEIPLMQGDVLLLCSDGLWGPLSEAEIAKALDSAPLPMALEQLMGLALFRENVSADNTTAVVARWGDAEQDHGVTEPFFGVLDER